MKFRLDESRSDITSLVKRLQEAEQANRAEKGDAELRALLNRSAHMLEECRTTMISCVQSLEEAVSLQAGMMDSASRQDEITRAKNRAMETAASFFKSLLQQHTPPPLKPRVPNSEVI